MSQTIEERRKKDHEYYIKNREAKLKYQKEHHKRKREGNLEYRRKYYAENKAHLLEQNSQWRKVQQDAVKKIKDVPCMDCGIKYPPYVMDFDHINGDKSFTIGPAVAKIGMEKLQEEIDKCEVVCANCHRERTFGGKI